jgi:hypothetical protein
MKIEKFEDIDAWKESRFLVGEIYGFMGTIRDYGFRDQIQRAAISIMSNIAEGFTEAPIRNLFTFLRLPGVQLLKFAVFSTRHRILARLSNRHVITCSCVAMQLQK